MDSWKEKREMLDSDIAGYIWAEQPEQYRRPQGVGEHPGRFSQE